MLKDLLFRKDNTLRFIEQSDDAGKRLAILLDCFGCSCGCRRSIGLEMCRSCPSRDLLGSSFIVSLYQWAESSGSAWICGEFKGLDLFGFGEALMRRNAQTEPGLSIPRPTLICWIGRGKAVRDPRSKPYLSVARRNLYKLCGLLGLSDRNMIVSVFDRVFNSEAFVRTDPFECSAEHFILQARPDWLKLAIESDRAISARSAGSPEGGACGDHAVWRSVIENTELTDAEFLTLLDRHFERLRGMEAARGEIIACAKTAWQKMTGCTCGEEELPWRRFFSEIYFGAVDPLLDAGMPAGGGYFAAGDGLDAMKANECAVLLELKAERNFPTSRILHKIIGGRANEEMIRKMLILLVFLSVYGGCAKNLPAERDAMFGRFRAECAERLASLGYRMLDVRDGYDIFILYCCTTFVPQLTFRRILLKKPT